MMDTQEADKLVKDLAAGFETLQEEYQKLFGRHQALERKLATAREQVRSDHLFCPSECTFCCDEHNLPLALDL